MEPPGSSAPDGRTIVPGAQLVLLALWLGAAAFFASAVAPASFAVLPSRELAGALVGRLLPLLYWSGAALGIALMALEAAHHQTRFRRARLAAAAVTGAACLVAQLSIAPRIASLRAGMTGPLASLPPDDPQRILFGRLHMLSVAWLAVAIV